MANASVLDGPAIFSDFGFTDEHRLARQQARRFLSERFSIAEVRRLAESGRGFDPDVYREMAELGWLGLTTSEALGGLGLDHLHLALLLDEMGRVLAPSPYLASLFALTAIDFSAGSEQKKAILASILSGDAVATLAFTEPGPSWGPEVETRAEPADGGYVLRGVKTHVPFGQSAHLVIVPCRQAGELFLFAVELPSKNLTVKAEVGVDPTRPTARLELDGVRVSKGARLEGSGEQAFEQALLRSAALLSCEMAGGIEAVLELTRSYAIERIQFGRPIGSFQAVKHPIVDMMIDCEWTRSLAYGAARVIDQDPDRADLLCRMAKVQASEAYLSAVKKGVQLHGGFGFTWDCDVHFYFKRALCSRTTLGDPTHHRAELARALFGD